MRQETDAMDLTFEQLDRDGALHETAAGVVGDDRAAFLMKAGLAGAGALTGSALLGLMADEARAQTPGDVSILNFALVLEELEAAFYRDAVRQGRLRGELLLFARVVGSHERAHVRALREVLGTQAVERPTFDFRNTTRNRRLFVQTAIQLEQTGLGAYKGQAPLIQSPAILAAALSIHSVEGRHTAWIRDIAGLNPAPRGLDAPIARAQVVERVRRTFFWVDPNPDD